VSKAAEHLEASLNICRSLYQQLQATQKLEGRPYALPVNLVGLCACGSLVIAAQGDYERALTLYSIADAVQSQGGRDIPPPLQTHLEEMIATIRTRLSNNNYDIAWQVGQAMSLADGLAFVLA
jgi:hypothetical protein